MTTNPVDPVAELEREAARSASPRISCLRYLLYGIAWILLYVLTLSLASDAVANRLHERAMAGQGSLVEGYGAFIALVAFPVVMPAGLLLSLTVLVFLRRVWVFLLLGFLIALAAAVIPVLL